MYSIAEAAELLGIGRSTAYDLVARGELSTVRIGGRSIVTRPTLAALLGIEPPLPGELDAVRGLSGMSIHRTDAVVRSTVSDTATSAQQPSLPFGA